MIDLLDIDRKYIWHPFTQQRDWERGRLEHSIVISRGKGIYLYDSRGKKYLDGVSSLWANLHGHRNPKLDAAILRQVQRFSHSTFLGLTHEPAIRFAQELSEVFPRDLKRVFYSDNGSTAVEVALKMAFQYWAQHGSKKRGEHAGMKSEFLALRNSYHGDTIGAVSAGGIELFHKKFRPLLFKTHFAMPPHCSRCPYNQASKEKKGKIANDASFTYYEYHGENPKPGDFRRETKCHWECLKDVSRILDKNKGKIAAAIIEPIVQGAGGILLMPPGYLRGFARLCRQNRVLLIADEVAVAFGRTGRMFACEHEDVSPDFLCLSKGITGGYLPLAVTATTERIYKAFLGKYEDFKTFFHGHTYTANPLACSVGRASLQLILSKKILRKTQKLSILLQRLLRELTELPIVGEVRQAGLIAGIEFVEDKRLFRPFPAAKRVGKKICKFALKRGLLLRPLGDTIVLMPPLCIKEMEIKTLVSGLKMSILEHCSK